MVTAFGEHLFRADVARTARYGSATDTFTGNGAQTSSCQLRVNLLGVLRFSCRFKTEQRLGVRAERFWLGSAVWSLARFNSVERKTHASAGSASRV